MDFQTLRKEAVRERFPFLKHHVPTKADVWIRPIKSDLAHKRPEFRSGYGDNGYGEYRCNIFLLNETGEKIGVVGEVPKLLPTKKLFGITLRREKLVTRKFPETVQEALNRVEGGFYILVTESRTIDRHHEATLHIPPDGQTAKAHLTQVLAEARLEEELRLRKKKEQHDAALAEEKRKNQEALNTEAARIDSLLREINER